MRFDFLRRANFAPSAEGATRKEEDHSRRGNTCVHDGQADSHAFFHSRLLSLEVQILTRPPFPPPPSRASPLSHPEFTLLALARLLRVGNLDKYTRVRHDLTEVDVGRIGGRRDGGRRVTSDQD